MVSGERETVQTMQQAAIVFLFAEQCLFSLFFNNTTVTLFSVSNGYVSFFPRSSGFLIHSLHIPSDFIKVTHRRSW